MKEVYVIKICTIINGMFVTVSYFHECGEPIEFSSYKEAENKLQDVKYSGHYQIEKYFKKVAFSSNRTF